MTLRCKYQTTLQQHVDCVDGEAQNCRVATGQCAALISHTVLVQLRVTEMLCCSLGAGNFGGDVLMY